MAFNLGLPSFSSQQFTVPTLPDGLGAKPADSDTIYQKYIHNAGFNSKTSLLEDIDVNGTGTTAAFSGTAGPLLGTVAITDSFLRWAGLNATDFTKSFGYEFVIYDSQTNGIYERCPLPIAPSNISMDIPAATSVTVTMKGIVEESNGAPLRPIRISGTTGVLPIQSEAPLANSNTSNAIADLAQYAFKNTIQAIGNTVGQANSLVATFTGSPQKTSCLNYGTSDIKAGGVTQGFNGYTYFHYLARFFDYYMALKKRNKRARLSFLMYKDQMYYDVVFGGFSFVKAPGTLEYQYNISLTAYRRKAAPPTTYRLSGQSMQPTQVASLNALASILNGIRQAPLVLESAFGVLSGIAGDIQGTFITPFTNLKALVTMLVNAPREAADYLSVVGAATLTTAFAAFNYSNLTGTTQNPSTAANVNAALAAANVSTNIAGQAPSVQAQADSEALNAGTTTIENTVFGALISSDPAQAVANIAPLTQLLAGIAPEDLPLSDAARQAIQDYDTKLSLMSASDFRVQRTMVESFMTTIEQAFGGGDPDYNRVSGLPAPQQTYRTMTTDDIALLDQMNDILNGFDQLIQYLDSLEPGITNDYFQFYQGAALNAGMTFANSNSSFLVPFQHGATLQTMAMAYLGDSDRWIEIAALNQLQAPYIDEIGFDVPLLNNGIANTVSIGSIANLYIGQTVSINSDTQQPTYAQINTIRVISDSEAVLSFTNLTLDLSNYKAGDGAHILAYMPNTVNSQNLIWMPSNGPVNATGKIQTVPGVQDLNGINQIAQVDLLLSAGYDLIVGSYGDVGLAIGLTNLIQASLIKLLTPQSSLLDDPTFGAGVAPGTPVADLDAQTVLTNLQNAYSGDGRFQGVSASQVLISGPTAQIYALVKVANTNLYLPLLTRIPVTTSGVTGAVGVTTQAPQP